MPAYYPKVLIVGQSFHKKSGAGITMTNLFCGWDKKNIAVAGIEMYNLDFSVCENFYRIGDLETERGFPFNFKLSEEHLKSEIIHKSNNQTVISNSGNSTINKVNKLVRIKDQLLFITGQIHRRRRFKISKEFSKWITEFSPDIIYSQLSSLEMIRFVNRINEDIKKPIVLHIMDDWPMTITSRQKGVFRLYWTHLINIELRQLFKKADVLLSISEAMSDEYLIRYGRKFMPFHNPIDVKSWSSATPKEYSKNESFKILYAGRIGTGLQNCLLDIAEAIQNLNNKGLKIEFHIQSTTNNIILKELSVFDFVTLRNPTQYNQLPDIFAAADLLLLPNDFDEKSVSFLKYSMPTKASEYMVSGTPILVFSSSETAVAKHAIKYEWAYVVSENSIEKLEIAIRKLYEDLDLRMVLAARAKVFAKKNYDSEKIRVDFKNAIINKHLSN